jgi:hypothetical protein
MGIPAKLTKLTMTNNCAMIKLRNVLSRQFDNRERVIQGDPLACLPFKFKKSNKRC